MKIKSISIKNYKGFENFSAKFHDELTVIVGDNGAGKSSLLDAVSIAAGTFLTDFNQGTSISKEDALLKSFDMGSIIDLQPQFPVIISAEGSVNHQPLSWRRELNSANGRTTVTNAREMIYSFLTNMSVPLSVLILRNYKRKKYDTHHKNSGATGIDRCQTPRSERLYRSGKRTEVRRSINKIIGKILSAAQISYFSQLISLFKTQIATIPNIVAICIIILL